MCIQHHNPDCLTAIVLSCGKRHLFWPIVPCNNYAAKSATQWLHEETTPDTNADARSHTHVVKNKKDKQTPRRTSPQTSSLKLLTKQLPRESRHSDQKKRKQKAASDLAGRHVVAREETCTNHITQRLTFKIICPTRWTSHI